MTHPHALPEAVEASKPAAKMKAGDVVKCSGIVTRPSSDGQGTYVQFSNNGKTVENYIPLDCAALSTREATPLEPGEISNTALEAAVRAFEDVKGMLTTDNTQKAIGAACAAYDAARRVQPLASTVDQDARNRVLEEAAKVAESNFNRDAGQIAAAIRALKQES